jgi:hypothetical protein
VHTVSQQPSQHALLRSRLEAAQAVGAASSLLVDARRLLRRCLVSEVQTSLEAALKPHSDWSVSQRASVLKAALDKSEATLGKFWARSEAASGQEAGQAEGACSTSNPTPISAAAPDGVPDGVSDSRSGASYVLTADSKPGGRSRTGMGLDDTRGKGRCNASVAVRLLGQKLSLLAWPVHCVEHS